MSPSWESWNNLFWGSVFDLNIGKIGLKLNTAPFFFRWFQGDCLFSPAAIALGSSAIIKVSGQNCFRTLYGSLGEIRLEFRGLWKVHQASTKVSPRFHQGFTKVAQVSRSLWSSGADPFWRAKRFCGRFPHHFFRLVSQLSSSTLFCIFPQQR